MTTREPRPESRRRLTNADMDAGRGDRVRPGRTGNQTPSLVPDLIAESSTVDVPDGVGEHRTVFEAPRGF